MSKGYYYISQTKVDSYSATLPVPVSERLGAEISVKLLALETKLRTRDPVNDLRSRLKMVVDHIESTEDLGTTEYPAKWVKDCLTVKHIRLDKNPEVLILVGEKKSNELCAIFGSASHIVGTKEVGLVGTRHSFFPDFADLILFDVNRLDLPDYKIDNLERLGSRLITGGCQDHEICDILNALYESAEVYPFEVEFLARHVFKEALIN